MGDTRDQGTSSSSPTDRLPGERLMTQGGWTVLEAALPPARWPSLGKGLLRFLLERTHGADIRDGTVADARDTQL